MDIKDDKGIIAAIPEITEIREIYMEDFLSEVREILDEIESELVNLEMDPGSKDSINSIYCGFHTIRGLTGLLNNAAGTQITIAAEELLEVVRKYCSITSKSVIDIILDSIVLIRTYCTNFPMLFDNKIPDKVERHIMLMEQHKEEIMLEVDPHGEKEFQAGKIPVQEGTMSGSPAEDFLKKQNSLYSKMKFGEIVLREKKVDASDIIKAIRMQKIRNTGTADQYVKIPLERLDQIIGIIQNVSSIYDSVKDEAILRFGSNDSLTIECSKAHHLINDVQNILKELRMVTLQQAFQKLTRSVCSIIEENHLEVMFSTMGENIEVDKEIADRIASPLGDLVKLLLEKIYSRSDGKSSKIGNIEVVAYEEANDVHIDITSDASANFDEILLDARYADALQKLTTMRCHLNPDRLNEEGTRISITYHR